ncbi:MAG: N-acetylglucosamine-6-phosphate deacetylase [Aurantimicrobium sp.]|uniref:N-acetylglucosamine-6-phosphate deacetylase n=2 Tax=Aurantimicrobium sp. TaxID=1930784 RepID=UPI002FCC2275
MPLDQVIIHSSKLCTSGQVLHSGWVRVNSQGFIAEIGTGESWKEFPAQQIVDANESWLAPGFLDIHCHGGKGISYESDSDNPLTSLDLHQIHGVTGSMLSLVSASLDEICQRLETLSKITDPRFLGIHLEGPFLSALYKGAHNEAALINPSASAVERLLSSASGTLRQITLAPELPGALEAIRTFVDADVAVAVGHTSANYEQAKAAFDSGATILTHTFNGMPALHHRQPGPILAALQNPNVFLELILDGTHVDVNVAKWLFDIAPGRVVLITDAMAAAGNEDGMYTLGGLEVNVVDGVARLCCGDSIAGSTLTLNQAVRNASILCDIDMVSVISSVTSTPAQAIGVQDSRGYLEIGRKADMVMFDSLDSLPRVWQAGHEISSPR